MQKIENISVIVLTKNEETGIDYTLRRLEDFSDITIVDSNSDDRTVEISRKRGALIKNFTWDGKYPKKKQWALENATTKNSWVLLLDADEYPSTELIRELREIAPDLAKSSAGAFDIHLRYRFAGKLLKHGHVVTKRSLLHRDRAKFPEVDDLGAPGIREVEGHYQPETTARIDTLRGRLIHDDRDPVTSWFARHNRYSDWEAHLRLHDDVRAKVAAKRSTKGQIFDRIPFKPLVFFGYSYFLRMGFLDGRAGLDYAIALATYYWQIEIKTRELARASSK